MKLSKIQIILIIIGSLGIFFVWDPPVPPNDVKIVETQDTAFPQVPTNPAILDSATKLKDLLIHEDDALTLARCFRDWAKFFNEDNEIRTTKEWQEVFQNSTYTFFLHADLIGKYPGSDALISEIISTSLRIADPVSFPTGQENVVLKTKIREGYTTALEAISWAGYQAWQASVLESNLVNTPTN